MNPVNSVIIHRKERLDRIPAIAALLSRYPQTQVLPAVVPDWEASSHNRAVRGCSLSHLSAVKAFLKPDAPLLVLEDDAVAIAPMDLADLPADAGILIVGGDVEDYGDDIVGGWREVFPKFWGTQAVVYLPSLLNSPFLLNAFEAAASLCLGRNEQGSSSGLCLESLLLTSMKRSDLKIYRPQHMAFSTVESVSDSTGAPLGARTKAIIATDRDGLLPFDTWSDVFAPWSGKKAFMADLPGNPGDAIIRQATLQLMRHFNIEQTTLEQADAVFLPGGGFLGSLYGSVPRDSTFVREYGKPRVILPHTWNNPDALGFEKVADEVWCRENHSPQILGRGKFAPDLALAYRPSLKATRENGLGIFFRQDIEATEVPAGNIGDPVAMCRSHYDYLRLAGSYRHVHTNRLHFAVAALLMGNQATLYPNSYHKNRSVWEASLKDLGCGWSDRF